MRDETMVYDSQKGKSVPATEAAKYMDEGWLDQWSCLHTTLDFIEAWKQYKARIATLQAENARLTRELAEARRALAAARITDADLSMIETDREPMD